MFLEAWLEVERDVWYGRDALPLPNVDGAAETRKAAPRDVLKLLVEPPLPRISLLGFAMMCWHLGIWRAAAFLLNVRPQ